MINTYHNFTSTIEFIKSDLKSSSVVRKHFYARLVTPLHVFFNIVHSVVEDLGYGLPIFMGGVLSLDKRKIVMGSKRANTALITLIVLPILGVVGGISPLLTQRGLFKLQVKLNPMHRKQQQDWQNIPRSFLIDRIMALAIGIFITPVSPLIDILDALDNLAGFKFKEFGECVITTPFAIGIGVYYTIKSLFNQKARDIVLDRI